MKRTRSTLALILALVFCIGLLAGCMSSTNTSSTNTTTSADDSSDDTDTGDTEDPADTDEAVETAQDLIGEVTDTGTDISTLTLALSTAPEAVTDYAALDLSTLTDAGQTAVVTIQEDAQFFYTDSGETYSASREDITVGSIIAVTVSDSGSQEIILLNYTAAGEAPMVARVEEVMEDGTLPLSLYTLTADAADYRITLYADVDFSCYEDTLEILEYVIGEDSGSNLVVIFHDDSSASE